MYERARPDYPDAAIEWIVGRLGLDPGAHVVDVGAGTGKFARLLAARGCRITGVEPIAEMRAVFERTLPDAAAVDGTGETMPLDDGVADAVVVAQAFHWLDPRRALPEFHRVLRERGGVALVWNIRDREHALQRAYAELLKPYRGGTYPDQVQHGDALAASPLFGDVDERSFRHSQTFDADALVARTESVSFVAQLPPDERGRLLERVRALAPAGQFEFPYVTKVFTARAQ